MTGKQIVEHAATRYPEYLRVTATKEQRIANMQFLRDRVIEKGKCEGLDLGLNLKRGGPTISNDFIAWRHDGMTEGVDIGAAYDEYTKPLKLIWHTYGPPDYGFPTYKDYGPVVCDPDDPPPTPPPPPSPPFDPAPLWSAIAVLNTRVDGLRDRVAALEHQPPPGLPALEAVGTTSRSWGHGHAIAIPVRRKQE